MIQRILAAVAVIWALMASAQAQNVQCRTAPVGTSTANCASEAFVTGSIAAIPAALPTPTRAGDLIYWNGSKWVALAGNNSGTQILQENASGVPSWVAVGGAGTVTSVALLNGTGGVSITGTNPITSSGSMTINVLTTAKSDQQAGTSNALEVTPLHQQDHDSATKAWVSFTGSTGAIQSSYNVSSVSRTSAGIYVVTFSTAFANALYAVNISAETNGGAAGFFGFVPNGGRSAGSCNVSYDAASFTPADPTTVFIQFHGRQ